MRGDSHVEGWEANPHFRKAFVGDGFAHCIKNILVGEGTIGTLLHLLNFGFGIVEGQTTE